MLNIDKPNIGALLASDMATEDIIERLAQMAEKGQVDPWDIDIIQVYDSFTESLRRRQHFNLRTGGRSLYYAALLLRLKADALEAWWLEPQPEEDGVIPGFFAPIIPDSDVRPRIRRQTQRRPVTLQELIEALRAAEKVFQHKVAREAPGLSAEDILRIPHEENAEDRLQSVHDLLQKMFQDGPVVPLSDLLSTLGRDTPTRVLTYLALLFLASPPRQAITLAQEEFFGELFIYPRKAPSPDEEARVEVHVDGE